MAKRDYYEVLGVSRSANEADLKTAYRKLAHQYHPDKNPGDKAAEESFKEVSEAYEVLSDSEKRARYNQYGHAGSGGSAGRPGTASVGDIFNDMFSDIFGGRPIHVEHKAKSSARRGNDLRYNLEIAFEEAAFGTAARIQIKKHKQCNECEGSGSRKGTKPQVCGSCRGSGESRVVSGFFTTARACGPCRGSGQVVVDPCKSCGGSGQVEHDQLIEVKVPAGVDTGTKIRYPGEGDFGTAGSGDLDIVISVRDHGLFIRDGADVSCDLPISFAQAALGSTVSVPTLDGMSEMTIPAGTQSGSVFRLKGKGISKLDGSGRGDQQLHINIETPRKLTKRQRELLQAFEAEATEDV